MNILISGGSGFIGSAITEVFLKKGYNVIILSRRKLKTPQRVSVIQSIDQINSGEKIDIIINLAGSSISKRWSQAYKRNLMSSRLEVTKNLVALIRRLKEKPALLISASAIGYYGSQNSDYIDESSSYVDDFTHELCNLWELEAQKAQEFGVRTCIARLGVVLGENGGALQKMLPLFKLGLGGKIGSGKQFFSWIHISDVIGIFNFLILRTEQKGIYNATSPSPVTNSQFTIALGRELKRSVFFTIPSFVIKAVFGEMGDKLLLNGAAVYPKKLLDSGYEFKFKLIEPALKNLINKSK
jgi:uncharacterized protein (TIGR01777 family)